MSANKVTEQHGSLKARLVRRSGLTRFTIVKVRATGHYHEEVRRILSGENKTSNHNKSHGADGEDTTPEKTALISPSPTHQTSNSDQVYPQVKAMAPSTVKQPSNNGLMPGNPPRGTTKINVKTPSKQTPPTSRPETPATTTTTNTPKEPSASLNNNPSSGGGRMIDPNDQRFKPDARIKHLTSLYKQELDNNIALRNQLEVSQRYINELEAKRKVLEKEVTELAKYRESIAQIRRSVSGL
ncbi:uncharacterized protein B0I36DRAFT_362181 [Microdochium trichocladiopsis]|uniref:Uncharacterized protein n=1 Tax=Microdochium trichocladiopsis TaxID=1682393 RepID=A0A9P9BS15_9PEZI|nr:uncharacterized protein B0I36DRAFT_362181 [Microdochium trichocladiopsis]KAH7033521.1 hypothetical protein B0I36DRAFT_362181 [Microdochium trichocladiopsis]